MKVNVYLMVLTLLHKFCKVSSYRQVLKMWRVQDSACSANKSFTVSSTTSPYSPFQILDITPYSYHNEGQGEIVELEVMAILTTVHKYCFFVFCLYSSYIYLCRVVCGSGISFCCQSHLVPVIFQF